MWFKKGKNISAILAVVVGITASLTACGGVTDTPSATQAGAQSGGEGGNTISEQSWTLGMDSPKDTVTYSYGQKFADELNSLSGGKINVDVYTDGTLGSDTALLESCKGGNVTFVVQNTAPEVSYIPKLAVFDLPMPFRKIQDFRARMDDEEFIGKVSKCYEDAGYHLLGMADQTFRVVSSNKKITGMDDFKGVKIRTMENSNHMAFWKSVGAAPTPMAFGELYTGLQQHTVDAQENPYAVIVANKFYEVQQYVIQTNHLPHTIAMITNSETFQSLSDEERAIVEKAAKTATDSARKDADDLETKSIQTIQDNGTEIDPISDELYQQMKDAAKPVYDSIAKAVGQDLVDSYLGTSSAS